MYYCNKCGGTSTTVNDCCQNPECPYMPCCLELRQNCNCEIGVKRVVYAVHCEVGMVLSLHTTKSGAWKAIKDRKLEHYQYWYNGTYPLPWEVGKVKKRYYSPYMGDYSIVEYKVN